MNVNPIDHVYSLIQEKKSLKGKPGYEEMNERVNALPRETFPFNQVMKTNEQWKREGKSDRKQAKRDLQATLIAEARPHAATLQTLATINCVHGTNSAVLALAPQELLPTGVLLDRGMAPMSGEISLGGTDRFGVNQQNISMYTTSNYQGSLHYATAISCSFHPPESFEEAFLHYLVQLEKALPPLPHPPLLHFYPLFQLTLQTHPLDRKHHPHFCLIPLILLTHEPNMS
ncbi:MAG: hypothetical protein KDK65_01690 [Chlamydiia bacterium]|nr:hypothetical protein [Chlamydiia bacterium]